MAVDISGEGALPPLRAYLVGGAVRDELLGKKGKDKDYVVVGETPERMEARGFKPVGKDFPVFIHPETGDDYALARTERKAGRGYKGFVFRYSPDVTLEEDLMRRDLTINAIARTPEGDLIDPHGGERDLEDGVLRHVSGAFAEDPLRLLRVARFRARFGFRIADETMRLMNEIVRRGEADHLVPERTWVELRNGLDEKKPSRMFDALERCGALERIFPGLARRWRAKYCGPGKFNGKKVGQKALALLDKCDYLKLPVEFKFALLFDDRESSEEDALSLIRETCSLLKVPAKARRYAESMARTRRLMLAQTEKSTPEGTLSLLAALNWPRDRMLNWRRDVPFNWLLDRMLNWGRECSPDRSPGIPPDRLLAVLLDRSHDISPDRLLALLFDRLPGIPPDRLFAVLLDKSQGISPDRLLVHLLSWRRARLLDGRHNPLLNWRRDRLLDWLLAHLPNGPPNIPPNRPHDASLDEQFARSLNGLLDRLLDRARSHMLGRLRKYSPNWPYDVRLNWPALLSSREALAMEQVSDAGETDVDEIVENVLYAAMRLLSEDTIGRIRGLGGEATRETVRRIRIEELERAGLSN